MRISVFVGGVQKKSDLELHENLGLDSEPEIIPMDVIIDMDRVEMITESIYNGTIRGTNIYLFSGESIWVDKPLDEVSKIWFI